MFPINALERSGTMAHAVSYVPHTAEHYAGTHFLRISALLQDPCILKRMFFRAQISSSLGRSSVVDPFGSQNRLSLKKMIFCPLGIRNQPVPGGPDSSPIWITEQTIPEEADFFDLLAY